MPATDPTSDPNHGSDANHGSNATDRATTTEPTHHDHTNELATLVDDTGDTNRHTICPARADATELLTTWLTVDETIVCDLDDWR